MKISVIGLGLIGGSIALDLKSRGFATYITGVDSNVRHAKIAIELKLADEICSLEDAVKKSKLILIATPVDACIEVLPKILDQINNNQIVCDLCSTKEKIIQSVQHHPRFKNFVPSHPMAGTEFTGPSAAHLGLFDYKCAIICNHENIASSAKNLIEKMYGCLNMHCIYMDARLHDNQAAYVSHLSHISAFALSLTVMHKEKKDKHIFELASGGFDSTVRLAKSAASMWTPIFIQNKKNIIKVLDSYIKTLKDFKHSIENEDKKNIFDLIEEANKIKSVIDKNDLIESKRNGKHNKQ